MAKFQFKVEVKPREGEAMPEPTIAQVADSLEAGLESSYPDAEVRVYDGERTDID